jgi:hypothetical protein
MPKKTKNKFSSATMAATLAATASFPKGTQGHLGQEATLSQLPIAPNYPVGVMEQYAYDVALRKQKENNQPSALNNRTSRSKNQTPKPTNHKQHEPEELHRLSNPNIHKPRRPRFSSPKGKKSKRKVKPPQLQRTLPKKFNKTRKNTNHRQRQGRGGGKNKN